MMIARWSVEVKFGHKDAALALMRRWWQEIAPPIGWSADQVRILSGSLGAPEATVEVEVRVDSLAALESAWSKLGGVAAQAEWTAAMKEHLVSGTPRWTVYRVVEV